MKITDDQRHRAEAMLIVGFLTVKQIAEQLQLDEVDVWQIMDEMEIIDPNDRF